MKHRWPHRNLDYPIECNKCKYQKDVEKSRFDTCLAYNIPMLRNSAFMECEKYEPKEEVKPIYAKKTQSKTESPRLEKRRKSQQ